VLWEKGLTFPHNWSVEQELGSRKLDSQNQTVFELFTEKDS